MSTRDKQREWFNWFLDNHDELYKQYPNKRLVIRDFSVVRAFDDENEALDWAVKNIGLGNFIIQWCTEGEEGWTVYIPFCQVIE